ncbi:MAG: NUDIX hydrolase [Gammaproteobacteria bacterium]
MHFCRNCGRPVVLKVPPGDHLPRYVCEHCGTIHYQNPRVVVGSIPVRGERVLLCRRAIEPRRGLWTLPAGFLENDETVEQGAARETLEEALATVEIGKLFALVNVPHVHQVHLFFLATLPEERYGVGAETLETALYAEAEVPWPQIAFPSVRFALETFFADRRRGGFAFHIHTWRQPLDP